MKRKRATLKDVAREAGVSVCTASRVIHNKGYISEDTKKRVEEAVSKLNYRQDMVARSLKTNSTDTIGFIVPDLSNPFFSVMGKGINRVISKKEYSLVVCDTDSDPLKEKRYLDLLLQKRVDGVVLASCGETEEKIKEVIDEGVPVVLVDNCIEGLDLDSVMVDNFMGAYELTSHLLRLGHTRIGLISGPLNESSARERLDGYKEALADHGIGFDSRLVTVGDFRLKSGYRSALELLSIVPPPTAIFATNNFMALGALNALKQKGLRVPLDLALVGFDMVEISSMVSPSITTMAYSPGRIGILAARLLLGKIEGGDGETQNLLLKPRLLIRESCGCRFSLGDREKLIEGALF